jgi:hypothetical protein
MTIAMSRIISVAKPHDARVECFCRMAIHRQLETPGDGIAHRGPALNGFSAFHPFGPVVVYFLAAFSNVWRLEIQTSEYDQESLETTHLREGERRYDED